MYDEENDEIDSKNEDILTAPTKIMLFTWLHGLFQNNNAKYNEENENIINLGSYASSWFIIGRDNESMDSFLGVPRILLPWFVDLGFISAVVSPKKGLLYISSGNKTKVGLTLSIKIRKKRISLLCDIKKYESKKNIGMRMFSVRADNKLIISENIICEMDFLVSDDINDVVLFKDVEKSDRYVLLEDEMKEKYQVEYIDAKQ